MDFNKQSLTSLFDDFNKEAETAERNRVEPTLQYIPEAYQIKRLVRKISFGETTTVTEVVDTIPVVKGKWQIAKETAQRKSRNIANSMVVEKCERVLDDNE